MTLHIFINFLGIIFCLFSMDLEFIRNSRGGSKLLLFATLMFSLSLTLQAMKGVTCE